MIPLISAKVWKAPKVLPPEIFLSSRNKNRISKAWLSKEKMSSECCRGCRYGRFITIFSQFWKENAGETRIFPIIVVMPLGLILLESITANGINSLSLECSVSLDISYLYVKEKETVSEVLQSIGYLINGFLTGSRGMIDGPTRLQARINRVVSCFGAFIVFIVLLGRAFLYIAEIFLP